MSEEAKGPRTIKEIQQEYSNACAKLGQLQYQISVYEFDANKVTREIRQLNKEASRLQEKQQLKMEIENGKSEDTATTAE